MSRDLDRRNWHAEQHANGLRKLGVEFRYEDLQRQAAEDLRVVDRLRSLGAIRQRKVDETAAAAKRARAQLHAEAQAAKVGAAFHRVEDPVDTKVVLPPVKGVDAERLAALGARVAELMRRGPGRIKGNNIEDGPFLYPAFARRLAVLTVWFSRGLGGFRGLSYVDRRRRYLRLVEQIADESDALFPGRNWWSRPLRTT